MPKKLREFVDKDHAIMTEYYDLINKHKGNIKAAKNKLKKLLEKDPDFLDPLSDIF